MRIARIVQYFQPRFGYVDYYLMSTLQRLGHKVCIITSDRYSPGVTLFDNSISIKISSGKSVEYGLTVYRLFTSIDVNGIICNLSGVKKTLDDFKPDVVHSNDLFYPATLLTAHYKKQLDYSFFVDSITGTFNPDCFNKLEFTLFKLLFAGYLRKNTDRFFAICEGSRKWLSKNFSIPYQSIQVIPLGVDKDRFSPNPYTRKIMRDNLSFNDDEIVLVYSGKITQDKDLHVLIKSLSFLPCFLLSKLKLMIIGNGTKRYLDYLMDLSTFYDVKRNIIIIPTVSTSELPMYFNASDVAVWPGSPSISIIEAMSCGLPIIIAKYPKLKADAFDTLHLLEYKNGLSFYRGNPIHSSACIKKLIMDKTLREAMGKRSRKLVEEKLNLNTIAKKYVDTYIETL